jgi:hypothetical protein
VSNILVDELPESVEIDGRACPVRADFRSCIRIILAFEDNDLTAYEKQLAMLENLYPEIPGNIEAAVRQGIKFLNGGQVEEEGDGEFDLRLYSFSKDAGLIFAAFRQTHGIDLEQAQLHWWKFLALFMDLGAETTFCNLVGLRKRIKTGRATKEEREQARDIGDLLDVPEPDTRTLAEREREAEFLRAIGEQ